MSKRKDWAKMAEDLHKEMRSKFKAANQRMVRIEKYSDPKSKEYKREYSAIKDFAYRVAQESLYDIKKTAGKNLRFKEDFSTKPFEKLAKEDPEKAYKEAKRSYKDMVKMAEAADKFLHSVSSVLKVTKKTKYVKEGLIDVYDKRTKTINHDYVEEYGLKGFTEQELSKFFASKKFDKLKEKYGSSQMFQIGAVVNKLPTSKKDIREYLKHHIDLDTVTDQDLQDADLLSKDQIMDILDNSNKIDDLRNLMHFVNFTDSDILNNQIADAISTLSLSKKNLF